MGAYLSLSLSLRRGEAGWGWALIRGWALIKFFCLQDGRLFEVVANSRLGAYSNKYGAIIYSLSTLNWIRIPQTMKRNKYLDLLLVSPGSRYQADFIFGIVLSTVLNAESS